MKISGQLDWKDYLKAQRLHMRPSRAARAALYVAMVVVIGALAYGFGAMAAGAGAEIWSWLLPLVIIGGLTVLYYYVLLPWNVRRIFSQQKELSVPLEHEITDSALVSSSQYGSGVRPWADFHKWKEDKDVLLLYMSDVMFVLIPKRFCTAEQVEAIRSHLVANKIPQNPRNPARLVLFAVYLAILIVVGIVVYWTTTKLTP